MRVETRETTGHLDLDRLGQDFIDDPYPVLAGLRERDRVPKVVYHGIPALMVTRFDDLKAMYTEPRLSVNPGNAPGHVRAVPWVAAAEALGLGQCLAAVDPPEHTRLRRLANAAFTPRHVERLRPQARAITERLVRDAAARGRADILADLSFPLAIEMIMGLIGVPATDTRAFQHNTYTFLSSDPADLPRVPEALVWLKTYIAGLVTAKRAAPGNDLLSALIAEGTDDERLTGPELEAMTLMLLVGGFNTVSSLIACGLLTLLRHPDQLAALRADPELIPGAVEEMLRYDATLGSSLIRFATEDLTFAGAEVRRGDVVVGSILAAHRDPRRFTDPDRFDIRRDVGRHLAFAHGIHYCLGAALARMEAQTAFAVLLELCGDIRLAVPVSELSYRVMPTVRVLESLPVLLAPAERSRPGR
ncbi:cytochrome P450 [Sphaerisporangium melleum]|uniref:Cytochrome P450 n=1 Tax=Sphaerisporangium melleum TaxID=321316 RepID=A0A917R6N3_9ACTN|nr:cytochrome P450 [Sphaerisporangium melleum]GGK91415.1 cytochrome P450 [Sphaerisporangium melleum]GII72897.1 cytochrome P450 [Sphaerisporangium melleum]